MDILIKNLCICPLCLEAATALGSGLLLCWVVQVMPHEHVGSCTASGAYEFETGFGIADLPTETGLIVSDRRRTQPLLSRKPMPGEFADSLNKKPCLATPAATQEAKKRKSPKPSTLKP